MYSPAKIQINLHSNRDPMPSSVPWRRSALGNSESRRVAQQDFKKGIFALARRQVGGVGQALVINISFAIVARIRCASSVASDTSPAYGPSVGIPDPRMQMSTWQCPPYLHMGTLAETMVFQHSYFIIHCSTSVALTHPILHWHPAFFEILLSLQYDIGISLMPVLMYNLALFFPQPE